MSQVKVGPMVTIAAGSRLQATKDMDDDFGDELTEADQGTHTELEDILQWAHSV